MEVTGKIIVALPEVGGTSQKGNPWKKREYVLETQETYPRKVFFNFFGDRVDQYPLQVGQLVKISFDIDSREYNGRWYVEVRAWKAEDATAMAAGSSACRIRCSHSLRTGPEYASGLCSTFGCSSSSDARPHSVGY